MKSASNPMHASPRCGAHARTTGAPCQSPAMSNGRCRMHGGKSPGAPKGNVNGLKHGGRSAAAVALRKEMNEILRANREALTLV